jgi:hypothetical protein
MCDGKNHRKINLDFHPASKQPISGVKVYRWEEMINEMIRLHSSMKFIKYVGWDIAITPESFIIIEANYAS